MLIAKTLALFVITALAEIVGCYLPWLWLKKDGSVWLLLPAIASLTLFAWLLTLHPAASGRVYAVYGGVYVATALLWLRYVDGVALSRSDMVGAAVALVGMAIIVLGWKAAVPRWNARAVRLRPPCALSAPPARSLQVDPIPDGVNAEHGCGIA